MENNVKILRKRYKAAKAAKVGETVICPSCGHKFVKKSYQQVFCKTFPGTKCKDNYWNNVTPTKRNNTTRISPASREWLDNRIDNDMSDYDPGDYEYWMNKDF